MKRLPAILLVVLLVGGNAAVVQGVAWATMLVERSQRMGWDRAVESTFSGREPCRMCCAAKALREDPSPATPQPDAKLLKVAMAPPAEMLVQPDEHAGPVARLAPGALAAMPSGFALQPQPPPPRPG